MISKELLSEILKEYKFPFSYEYNTYNDDTKKIYFYVNSELKIDFFSINIYELAHKCKEWATENKYTILTEDMHPNGYFAYVLSNKESIENYGYLCEHKVIKDIPHNKTEPEAIFAACQWVLDNRS